nr:ATP-binding cassette domain-containing protein [Brucella pseudogrignonensis]
MIAVIVSTTLVGMLGTMFLPLFISHLIDAVLTKDVTPWLVFLGVFATATAIISPIAHLYSTYYSTQLSGHIDLNLQKSIYVQMLKVRGDKLPRSSGETLSIFNNARNISAFVSGSVSTAFTDLGTSFISFCLMLYYDVSISFAVLFLASVTSFVMTRTQRPVVSAIQDNFKNMSLRQSLLSESIRNVSLIKSQTMQLHMLTQWKTIVSANVLSAARVMYFGGTANAVSSISSSVITLVVAVIGIVKVQSGSISYGDLVALGVLASSMTMPISSAAAMARQFHEANEAMRELQRFFRQPRDRAIVTPAKRALNSADMRIQNLSYRYDGQEHPALSNIHLDLPEQGLVAIVGSNGAGKSTLLSIILGERTDYTGEILFGGSDRRDYDPQFLRHMLGSVSQESTLFSGTLAENFYAGHKGPFDSNDKKLKSSLQFSGALSFVDSLPEGLNTRVLEDGKNFSGGQRQRLSIARTVYRNPRIAIFDEPTSSLDAESALRVERSIADWAATRLVILVTHHLHAITAAQIIVVLDRGSVVDVGTHAELKDRCDNYRAMWKNYIRDQ